MAISAMTLATVASGTSDAAAEVKGGVALPALHRFMG